MNVNRKANNCILHATRVVVAIAPRAGLRWRCSSRGAPGNAAHCCSATRRRAARGAGAAAAAARECRAHAAARARLREQARVALQRALHRHSHRSNVLYSVRVVRSILLVLYTVHARVHCAQEHRAEPVIRGLSLYDQFEEARPVLA